MNADQSLYEWFEGTTRTRSPEMMKFSACNVIAHHIGVLMGLGVEEEDIAGFLDRTLRMSAALMRRISNDRSLGENLDAMFAAPALVSIEGGKQQTANHQPPTAKSSKQTFDPFSDPSESS